MIRNFVFTVGLPGCGKSTWLNKNYVNVFDPKKYFGRGCDYLLPNFSISRLFDTDIMVDYFKKHVDDKAMSNIPEGIKPAVIVAADDIKPWIPGYNSDNPEPVHEDSVKYAEKFVYNICSSKDIDIDTLVMDGGGINNNYTARIIERIRAAKDIADYPEVKITCVYFDTPVEVCLERVSKRERKVPTNDIYSKNQKILKCIHRYKTMVDEFIRVNYFTNKYILLDMDGTICGYGKARFDEDGNADFVNGELFRHLLPVRSVIDFVKANYDMKNVYIVTAVANSIAWTEKNEWLDKHFPEIPKENRYFCGNKDYKYVFVKQLAEYKKWGRNEMVLIDDYHKTIELCKKHKINCVHPSNIEALTDSYAIFS